MTPIRIVGIAIAALVSMVLLTGCGSTPRATNLQVNMTLNEQLAQSGRVPSIEVDVIGLNQSQLETFRTVSLSEYFLSSLRRDTNKKTFYFASGNTEPKTLARTDGVWKEWIDGQGAMYLAVLADIPGVTQDLPGEADPRRLILPLDRSRWSGTRVDIRVDGSGLTLLTPPKPAAD